ncbi:hypothetical protein N7492_010094 [Penicillium capsulatum]|uniref:Shugoshin n=1 Tax=Penicillium capsulatum TaxID=69766 RepID=A0A9W9HQI7_9EURO|nr:hypothetical protein N7492_010094 [Penicillium capsulatum]KAJ6112603.1 hypothetical protein N7512_007927 [Penicillium capsulatum]
MMVDDGHAHPSHIMVTGPDSAESSRMARLNDFTAPAESIEALKRRFVRQNREIARVNSIQSLRIRSLESEVSHLLAENVSLREQVINLTHDIDRLEAAKSLSNGVYEIKSRLDAKLAELSGLANDLGMLPRKVGKPEGGKQDTELDRPKATAPESRPRPTDPEGPPDLDDGRLPAILEDKYYPRRTLEAREIQSLTEADASVIETSPQPQQSPIGGLDLGLESPTPNMNEDRLQNRTSEGESPDLFFPSTLETRKRKKKPTQSTDPVAKEATRGDSDSSGTTLTRKSGSKRKFSPDDDGFLSDPASEDEFQFSRPSHTPRKNTEPTETIQQESLPSKTPINSDTRPIKPASTKRKVLEPKSANVNLGSPKKARSLHTDSKILPPAASNENEMSPQKPKELLNHKPKRPSQAVRGSRAASDSLKAKRSSRSIGTEDASEISPNVQSDEALAADFDANTMSRPSRRRGAVVSYAEPNLRAKMRRPTKEMIDAVANEDARRSSSFQFLPDGFSDERDKNHGGTPGHSPRLRPSGTLPADLALADQATDHFKNHPAQSLVGVSQRRSKISLGNGDDRSSTDYNESAGGFAPETSTLDELRSNSKHTARRQPRRHSSNPKSTSRKAPSMRDVDTSGEPQSPYRDTASLQQSILEDEDAEWKDSMDAGVRRETRIATRRRSMMV